MIIGTYQNGNYTTAIYSDGTRIRTTEADEFVPDFAECMDVQISSKCDNRCPWCYAGCTPDGQIANLRAYEPLFATVHPYTEFAINMNFPLSDDFDWFLSYMRERRVIVNATVAQTDFIAHKDEIGYYTDNKFIHGIGVSLMDSGNKRFLALAPKFPNLVVHVIAGIFTEHDLDRLANRDLKLLILGYKHTGRGFGYAVDHNEDVERNIQWAHDNVKQIVDGFKAVSFDNLALEQLEMRRFMTDAEWNEFYSGGEGEFTYYIDLVNGTFAMNSLNPPIGAIDDKTADEMFQIVRERRQVC